MLPARGWDRDRRGEEWPDFVRIGGGRRVEKYAASTVRILDPLTALVSMTYDGGEGGIRTRSGAFESASYRNHVAKVAILARTAVAHCPPLPGGGTAQISPFLTRPTRNPDETLREAVTGVAACPLWG
jgi:hypothetical protein